MVVYYEPKQILMHHMDSTYIVGSTRHGAGNCSYYVYNFNEYNITSGGY